LRHLHLLNVRHSGAKVYQAFSFGGFESGANLRHITRRRVVAVNLEGGVL
jgi:hypothetical protein